jgi:retinol dehydrogenase 14
VVKIISAQNYAGVDKLARCLEGTGVTANCLHPGFVATHFGQRDVGPAFRLLVKVIGSFGTSPEKGAKTSIYLASSPDVDCVTGTYFVKSIPKRSAAISYDESLQRHLWKQSAQLVNV